MPATLEALATPVMCNITYHSIETPAVELFGFHWFPQDFLLKRLPVQPGLLFRPEVESLSWDTPGGRLRFRTDSRRIVLKGVRFGFGVMDHMTATGSHGFDLYIGPPGQERFAGVASTFQGKTNNFEVPLWESAQSTGMQDFTLFFPLYEGVKRLELGLDADARLEPPLPFGPDPRPIVVYGTSITQGGCASRPSLCWTNQLSLLLQRNVYNFGFSGNGKGEPEIARALAQVPDPALYILDYEANITDKFTETLPPFLDILQEAHPTTPILILTSYHFAPSHTQFYYEENRVFARAEVERRNQNGKKLLHFLAGPDTMGNLDTEATADGCHATDLGFTNIARTLAKLIPTILTNTYIYRQKQTIADKTAPQMPASTNHADTSGTLSLGFGGALAPDEKMRETLPPEKQAAISFRTPFDSDFTREDGAFPETLGFGGRLRFRTNSSRVMLRFALDATSTTPHPTQTYQSSCGFDLYEGSPGNEHYYGTSRSTKSVGDILMVHETGTSERPLREFTLYLPLFAKLEQLEIGLDAGASIEPPTPLAAPPLLLVGGDLAMGRSASRPGMSLANQLARMLRRPVLPCSQQRLAELQQTTETSAILFVQGSADQMPATPHPPARLVHWPELAAQLGPYPDDCFTDATHLNDLGLHAIAQYLAQHLSPTPKTETEK